MCMVGRVDAGQRRCVIRAERAPQVNVSAAVRHFPGRKNALESFRLRTMPDKFFQNTIALVYDFDGTLSPQPMQEYTVLPKIGVEPAAFWALVNREARESESDPMLVYMRHIIEAIELHRVDVKRGDFAKMARAIQYFP